MAVPEGRKCGVASVRCSPLFVWWSHETSMLSMTGDGCFGGVSMCAIVSRAPYGNVKKNDSRRSRVSRGSW